MYAFVMKMMWELL